MYTSPITWNFTSPIGSQGTRQCNMHHGILPFGFGLFLRPAQQRHESGTAGGILVVPRTTFVGCDIQSSPGALGTKSLVLCLTTVPQSYCILHVCWKRRHLRLLAEPTAHMSRRCSLPEQSPNMHFCGELFCKSAVPWVLLHNALRGCCTFDSVGCLGG